MITLSSKLFIISMFFTLLIVTSLYPVQSSSEKYIVLLDNARYLYGVLGSYDYDKDGLSEIFLFIDETTDYSKPEIRIYGSKGLEKTIDLSGVIDPDLIVLGYLFDSDNNVLYLSSIMLGESPVVNESYYIISLIGVDLRSNEVVYYDTHMLTGLCDYMPLSYPDTSTIYKIDKVYNNVLLLNIPLHTVCNEYVHVVWNLRDKSIRYVVSYKVRYPFEYTLLYNLVMTSRVVPGGIDPYPVIINDTNKLFITPTGEIYEITSSGSIIRIGILDIDGFVILSYAPSSMSGEIYALLTKNISGNNYTLIFARINIWNNKKYIYHNLEMNRSEYNILVIQHYGRDYFIRGVMGNDSATRIFTDKIVIVTPDLVYTASIPGNAVSNVLSIGTSDYIFLSGIGDEYYIDLMNNAFGVKRINYLGSIISGDKGVNILFADGSRLWLVVFSNPVFMLRWFSLILVNDENLLQPPSLKPLSEPIHIPVVLFLTTILFIVGRKYVRLKKG